MTTQEFPYRILITGENIVRIPQVKDFSVTLTMNRFSDTFNLTLGLKYASLLEKVPPYAIVEVYYLEERVFRGTIESRYTGWRSGAKVLVLRGRSIISDKTEGDIDPKTYTQTTDNTLIEEMLGGEGVEFDLDPPEKLLDFDLQTSLTPSEIAFLAAKHTGFHLWFNGNTVYKKLVNSEDTLFEQTYFTYDTDGIKGIPIIKESDEVQEDFMDVRSNFKTATSGMNNEKIIREVSITPTLKMRTPETVLDKTRTLRYQMPAKTVEEAETHIQNTKEQGQPVEWLGFKVRRFDTVALNTPVKVVMPAWLVDGVFIVTQKEITLDQKGVATTRIQCIVPGRRLTK